ncbi:MAG: hypothetical protein GWN96_15495 [candidate division Zixibacteria bacterium]|nr:hypothetical protein [candidate division Zixibacteria bacterium]NIW45697.1 hypothetical protein [Gammaproteobacteria bacterium]
MYLNIEETITKLEILETQFPDLCEILTLPEQTFENRDVLALRVKTDTTKTKHGILIVAGLHAREWGATDIVIFFIEEILNAFSASSDLVLGNKTYTAAEIQSIVDKLDIFIVPVANPDGKHFSFQDGNDEQGEPKFEWRKNRRVNDNSECRGVDLNRNFDFLWDLNTMHPESLFENDPNMCQGVTVASEDPCSIVYHGRRMFSEPETRNILSLLNTYPHIRFFIDVHGTEGLVLMPWGHEQIQNTDPYMNFLNDTYDGLRGLTDFLHQTKFGCTSEVLNPDGSKYKEYMHPVDQSRFELLGETQRQAIEDVRGQAYIFAPGFTGLYGITGGTKDYGLSRHMVDPDRSKLDTFLYEYGINTDFQPPFEDPSAPDDMVRVIKDCASGLISLCVNAQRVPIVDHHPKIMDFGKVRIGETEHAFIRLINKSNRELEITNVNVISAGPVPFSVTPPSVSIISANQFIDIRVSAAPTDTNQVKAFVGIEFRYHGEKAIQDVRMIECFAAGCEVEEDACMAPVFSAGNAFFCLLNSIILFLAIAVLLPFIWIPSVHCRIKQMWFRIQNCTSGNSDTCREL